MNREEAALLFKGSSADDIDSEFEERFFELKQFVIQNVPIRKVWSSKLRKLAKLEQARILLLDISPEPRDQARFEKPEFSDEILVAFNQFQSAKNELRQQILMASNFEELSEIMNRYLVLSDEYAALWRVEVADNEDVLVSKAPDDMQLLKAIKALNDNDIRTFEDLKSLPDDHMLVLEGKRLTLLSKLNQNAG